MSRITPEQRKGADGVCETTDKGGVRVNVEDVHNIGSEDALRGVSGGKRAKGGGGETARAESKRGRKRSKKKAEESGSDTETTAE